MAKCANCDAAIRSGTFAAHLAHHHAVEGKPFYVSCICGEVHFAVQASDLDEHFKTCTALLQDQAYHDRLNGTS